MMVIVRRDHRKLPADPEVKIRIWLRFSFTDKAFSLRKTRIHRILECMFDTLDAELAAWLADVPEPD
jgi:hypothetical protein